MRIAVIGAKIIGGTLGRKWAQAGHTVMFGVRSVDNPEVQALAQELGATVGTPAEAIAFGDVVVFAIPGSAMEETIAAHGQALAGKIVIDAANRMGGGPMNSAAAFAAHAPAAQVYRAFNSVGWEVFADPQFGDLPADLFYCGPGGAGQAVVEQPIRDVGLRPVRVGDISQCEAWEGTKKVLVKTPCDMIKLRLRSICAVFSPSDPAKRVFGQSGAEILSPRQPSTPLTAALRAG